MFEYYLDYFAIGVVVGVLLMVMLFLILYLFGWIAMKSDFSDEWLTRANIVIVNKGKRR